MINKEFGRNLLDVGELLDRYRELTAELANEDLDEFVREDFEDELSEIDGFAEAVRRDLGMTGTTEEILGELAKDEPILIEEDYFPTYAEEQAVDWFGVDLDVWPFYCIDWEKATRKLKRDYSPVRFRSFTYYVPVF